MLRKTGILSDYKEVKVLNTKRVIINFDKVDIPDESNSLLATWSQQGYYYRPTNEEMQNDVRTYTIQRYVNEGLEPPKPEDIDVSAYVLP